MYVRCSFHEHLTCTFPAHDVGTISRSEIPPKTPPPNCVMTKSAATLPHSPRDLPPSTSRTTPRGTLQGGIRCLRCHTALVPINAAPDPDDELVSFVRALWTQRTCSSRNQSYPLTLPLRNLTPPRLLPPPARMPWPSFRSPSDLRSCT